MITISTKTNIFDGYLKGQNMSTLRRLTLRGVEFFELNLKFKYLREN